MHLEIFKFLKEFDHYVCTVHDYMERVDLSKGYHNPERKLGVTADFSGNWASIWKEIAYIFCILALFWK